MKTLILSLIAFSVMSTQAATTPTRLKECYSDNTDCIAHPAPAYSIPGLTGSAGVEFNIPNASMCSNGCSTPLTDTALIRSDSLPEGSLPKVDSTTEGVGL